VKPDVLKQGISANKPAVCNAKNAIDQYYNEMFESLGEIPVDGESSVKSLGSDEHLMEAVDSNAAANIITNEIKHNVVVSKPKLRPKKPVASKQALPFDEPKASSRLSQFILPATFPQLAPVLSESSEAVVESRLLDRDSALAILAAKKSNLSERQLERLRARLGHDDLSRIVASSSESRTSKNVSSATKPKIKIEPQIHTVDGVSEATCSVDISSDQDSRAAWLPNGRPSWAQDRFDCLLFTVAGLKLAVPLISLGAIYRINQELTPLVGRADWFMGLYRHLDHNVNVVDTARWVMPHRANKEPRDEYSFVIRLGGNDWGMACNAVHEAFQLEPSQVKWRTERSKRAWLSGTVIGHMCALLDVDALSSMLYQEAAKEPALFSA